MVQEFPGGPLHCELKPAQPAPPVLERDAPGCQNASRITTRTFILVCRASTKNPVLLLGLENFSADFESWTCV